MSFALQPTHIFVNPAFLSGKQHIVVKHPTKPYVRKCKRDQPQGMSLIDAVFKSAYMNMPDEYPDLFKEDGDAVDPCAK